MTNARIAQPPALSTHRLNMLLVLIADVLHPIGLVQRPLKRTRAHTGIRQTEGDSSFSFRLLHFSSPEYACAFPFSGPCTLIW